MKMVRKQVYIEPEQDKKLKRLAKQLGMTEAELIRRGIDLVEDYSDTDEARKKAWAEELAYMKRRAQQYPAIPDGNRTWTRDETYDERPEYLSRRL
jgi:predicted DNA-binding protein